MKKNEYKTIDLKMVTIDFEVSQYEFKQKTNEKTKDSWELV